MSQISFVYVVPHRNGKLFKVGKANNVLSRFRQIGLRSLDVEKALTLQVCESSVSTAEKSALDIEAGLRGFFSRYRLTPTQARRLGAPQSGQTEWFSEAGIAHLVAVVEMYAEKEEVPLVRGVALLPARRPALPSSKQSVIAGPVSPKIITNPYFADQLNHSNLRGYVFDEWGEPLEMDIFPPEGYEVEADWQSILEVHGDLPCEGVVDANPLRSIASIDVLPKLNDLSISLDQSWVF